MWQEVMAAVNPWVYAEANRDRKKHRKPYSLQEWTVKGLTTPRKRKVVRDPATVFGGISAGLTALGGKTDVKPSR